MANVQDKTNFAQHGAANIMIHTPEPRGTCVYRSLMGLKFVDRLREVAVLNKTCV